MAGFLLKVQSMFCNGHGGGMRNMCEDTAAERALQRRF